jgi:hypothetical protein
MFYFLHCLEFETLLKYFLWPYIALQDLTVEESSLMPNMTGAESVHSAMQKCHSQKKVGLLEVCEMDQNRSVAQIAAYTSYLNGAHRGKGPTLFELAFRSADIVGTPTNFIYATNLWIESEHKLSQTKPLTGDVRIKLQKQKVNASADITPKDSHCHDMMLITSPTTRGFWRRNLHVTDFGTMPSDIDKTSTPESAMTELPWTPFLRPVTQS